MKKIVSTILFVLLFAGVSLRAQTFHFLGFFNTDDPRIGDSCALDEERVMEVMKEVAMTMSDLGYSTDVRHFNERECRKNKLMSVLDSTKIDNTDVVVFFYSGHGAHSDDEQDTDPFPQMCMGERYESNFVPATLVKNTFVEKGARLVVMFTDCCNKESEWVAPKPLHVQKSFDARQQQMRSVCKKLFVEPKGYVMFTGCKKGEYSYCNKRLGGYMTHSFISVWNSVIDGSCRAKWDYICPQVKQECQAIEISGKTHVQNPYFEISWRTHGSTSGCSTQVAVDSTGTDHGGVLRAASDSFDQLNKDANSLLDSRISLSEKRKSISSMMETYFKTDSIIVSVWEATNKVLFYEDADVYLRRLAETSDIKKVRFFKQESGKYYVYEY